MLSRRCSKTLKYLDIESSRAIRDDGEGQELSSISCLASLTKLTAVEEMNLFDTKLGHETLAKILLALPNLTNLIRGDFLCDALEWIEYWVIYFYNST